MDPHPSSPSRDAVLHAAALPVGRLEQKAWKRIAGRNFALIA